MNMYEQSDETEIGMLAGKVAARDRRGYLPRMLRAALASVLLVVGCAEDDDHALEPAPLAEICGEAGPVQLLTLAPDQRIGDWRAFAASGERLLFVAGKVDGYGPGGARLVETTVHAVGPCGEDPVVVAEGVEHVFTEQGHPGVVFGCTEEGDLVRLDPSGVAPPRLLAHTSCYSTFTPYGVLAYTGEGGEVTVNYHPLLDTEGPTFGPPVPVAAPVTTVNALTSSVRIAQDEVLMVEDGELARYGLPGLERSVLAYDAVVFALSPDGRFLFSQGPGGGPDQYNPVGPIHGFDRESGVSGAIGLGVLTQAEFVAPDVLSLDVVNETAHQRLVSLPDFSFVEVPEGLKVVSRLADGRWLTSTEDLGPWYVFDAADDTITLVSGYQGRRGRSVERHLDLLLSTAQNPQGMGELVRYFYDGRAPRTLAERANRNALVRDDESVLTLVDVDDEWLGTLTVGHASGAKALHLDERVTVASDLASWSHPAGAGAVIYGVVDGERTGVWVARPEP